MDENRKVPQRVLDELGEAGYWGLLVDQQVRRQRARRSPALPRF